MVDRANSGTYLRARYEAYVFLKSGRLGYLLSEPGWTNRGTPARFAFCPNAIAVDVNAPVSLGAVGSKGIKTLVSIRNFKE
jgi:hypothetical protein